VTPQTTLRGQATATLTLDLGSDPITDTGGVGAMVGFTLLAPDGSSVPVAGNPVQTSSTVTQNFAGLTPGNVYTARATVAPPQHPEATVTIGPQKTFTSASWPALSLAIQPFAVTGSASGNLTFTIQGVTHADTGELFDLINSSLTCGSTSLPLLAKAIDPAQPLTFKIDNSTYFGSDCTVKVQLQENGATVTTPPVFGTNSGSTSGSVNIPRPDINLLNASFTMTWDPNATVAAPAVDFNYKPSLWSLSSGVHISVVDTDGTVCGSFSQPASSQLPSTGFEIGIDPACFTADGADTSTWTATVQYTFFGVPGSGNATGITGTPPQ